MVKLIVTVEVLRVGAVPSSNCDLPRKHLLSDFLTSLLVFKSVVLLPSAYVDSLQKKKSNFIAKSGLFFFNDHFVLQHLSRKS